MSQASTVIANGTGDVVRAAINAALAAIVSEFGGATAPSGLVAYQRWVDESVSPRALMIYDGAQSLTTGWLDTSGHRWLPKIGGGKATIASAATTNLGASAETFLTISGTTTITSLGSTATEGETKLVTFSGALTLTHNATSLILPTGANISTAAGDVAVFTALGSGNWQCVSYWPAGGSLSAGQPTLASAATTNLGSVSAASIIISGTTTITSFGSTAKNGSVRNLTFSGALTLTHNGTSLILPGAANIVTAAGDTATVIALGSGNWRMLSYQRAGGMSAFLDAAFGSTRGMILYRGASAWAALGVGTAGNLLQTGGAGADPSWASYPTIVSLEGLSLAAGDMLYATAADTLARLPKGTDGQALILASGLPAWGSRREVLTANRTYYVRTDGSDSNDGSANTSGAAFATINKAISTIRDTLDLGGKSVTIQLGNSGTFAQFTASGAWFGAGTVTLQGDTVTPANTIVDSASLSNVLGGARLSVASFEFRATGGTGCVNVQDPGSVLTLGAGMRFGTSSGYHMRAQLYGNISGLSAAYTIVGGATIHWYASPSANINMASAAITLTGTPAFGTAFAVADRLSLINCNSAGFTGSATGVRYTVATNSVVNTAGGGASFLPGGTAGSTATGGQYV